MMISAPAEKGEPMAEYIERGKAKRYFENIDSGRREWPTLLTPTEFAEYLDEIDTADVAPVVHGRWEKCSEHISKYYFRCSACKMYYMDGVTGAIAPKYGSRAWNYCPHCGARMDSEVMDNGQK